MSEQPHRPSDRTLTVPEIEQPDADGDRASVRPLRPAPVRPVEVARPVPVPVRESTDVDLFRPAVRDVTPASGRSGSADPSGFGFAGPARTRTPATGAPRRPARTARRPSHAPHIAVAIAVPTAGVAGVILSVVLSPGLAVQVLVYGVIGSVVLVKIAGPVRAVVAFLAAVVAKIGPR